MCKCPTIHEHIEFQKSYNPSNSKQKYEVNKIQKYLQSDAGISFGEVLKHGLHPFKSFPRGHVNIRCFFILCRDCKQDALYPKCSFCNDKEHSMNDAVLFYIGDHKKSYKEGKKVISKYLKKKSNK